MQVDWRLWQEGERRASEEEGFPAHHRTLAAFSVAKLMGHNSSRTVEPGSAHLNDIAFRNAMNQRPARPVTPADGSNWGADGTGFPEPGEPPETRHPPHLQEQPVPGAGIEPATRGFSGRNVPVARPRLRLVLPLRLAAGS